MATTRAVGSGGKCTVAPKREIYDVRRLRRGCVGLVVENVERKKEGKKEWAKKET